MEKLNQITPFSSGFGNKATPRSAFRYCAFSEKSSPRIRSKTKKTIERFYEGIEEIYLPLLTIGILIDRQEDKVLFRGSKADAETGDAVLISS